MPSPWQQMMSQPEPILALAPMQDITDLPFWRLLASYGGADLYFTEYFRVHAESRVSREVLRPVLENPTGKPVVAQMIGSDIAGLVRTAKALQEYPIAAVDLNLGCPAPVVYRKCAGGGLLRDLATVDAILGALREAVTVPLSVKTRLGFDSAACLDELLDVLARHSLDLVTVHGRTVQEMYRSPVRYDLIARAVLRLSCPVLANGDVWSAPKAQSVLARTRARGLMLGRGAVRNPWLFQQIRQAIRGEKPASPTGRDLIEYLAALYDTVWMPGFKERGHVQRIKKHLTFIALGIEPTGQLRHQALRVKTKEDLFTVFREFLDHDRPVPFESMD